MGLWEGAGEGLRVAGVTRSQNRRFRGRPVRHQMIQIDPLALVSHNHPPQTNRD